MKWVFARQWAETQTVRISCGGRLTLTGHSAPEVSASVSPRDSCEDGEVLLEFDEDAIVAIPPAIGPVHVDDCAGELNASNLQCFLNINRARQDARVARHTGGLSVGTAQVLRLRGVEGGVEVHEVGGELSIRGVNGGVRIDHCGGDCTVSGLNGGCQIASAGGDLSIRGMNGGLLAESVDGDLVLIGYNGGVQAQSVGGDATVKGMSGGLELEKVHGDASIVGTSGGLSLGEVDGDCKVKGNSGGFRANHVGGNLSLKGQSGSAEAGLVGGDLLVKRGCGSLRFDRVEGKAEASDVEANDVRIVALGDVNVQGEDQGQGRWELTSEMGNVRVALPEDAQPVLARADAGGEVACEFETREGDQGPELLLSAAGDIGVVTYEVPRRRGRSCGARARRHVEGPIPDVEKMVSDVMGPLFGRKPKPADLREERLMVLKMLETGKVDAEEAARLLDALGSG